jgi:NAD(P)-dependent dehydrogenase (short-subunit alcohol dehydrogenase family)
MFSITGHTRGIGKALVNELNGNYKGFSRSNGYDIRLKDSRAKIINESAESDVFVNCAYCGDDSQTTLLYELFDKWKNLSKIIVNIGSETTEGIKRHPWPYTAHKASLDKASQQLSHLNMPCRVINIRFGYVGTERVLRDYNPKEYILPSDAAKFILNQLEVSKNYRLTESLLRP